MSVLRVLAAVVLGFVFSMVVVVAASLVLGGTLDPASLAVLQIVMWVLGAWSLLRSWARRRANRGVRVTDDSGATLLLDDVAGADGLSDSPDEVSVAPVSKAGSEEPRVASRTGPVAAVGQTRWGRYALAGLAVVAVLVASVAAGFWGSRLAAAPAATARSTLPPATIRAAVLDAADLYVRRTTFESVLGSFEALEDRSAWDSHSAYWYCPELRPDLLDVESETLWLKRAQSWMGHLRGENDEVRRHLLTELPPLAGVVILPGHKSIEDARSSIVEHETIWIELLTEQSQMILVAANRTDPNEYWEAAVGVFNVSALRGPEIRATFEVAIANLMDAVPPLPGSDGFRERIDALDRPIEFDCAAFPQIGT